jgi:hypothetical protein
VAGSRPVFTPPPATSPPSAEPPRRLRRAFTRPFTRPSPAHTTTDRSQRTRSPRNRRSNDHGSVHAVHAPKRSHAGPPLEGGLRERPCVNARPLHLSPPRKAMPPADVSPLSAEGAASPLLPPWATSPALTAVLLAAVVVLALFAAWMIRQQRRQPPGANRWRATTAVQVAAVAAVGCTAYSADTSWRFAGDYLAMTSSVERAFMFAIAELALFATALMARQDLNGPGRAPGLPGVLVGEVDAMGGVARVPGRVQAGLCHHMVRQDQEAEEEQSHARQVGAEQRSAAEWRRMTLALSASSDAVGYTRIQERLHEAGVHDPGAGSSVAARTSPRADCSHPNGPTPATRPAAHRRETARPAGPTEPTEGRRD